MNELPLVPVPPGVVTLTVPVVPVPTTAKIWLAVIDVIELTAVLPIVTAVAPVKFVPFIVIVEPTQPEVGVKLVIAGGVSAITVKV